MKYKLLIMMVILANLLLISGCNLFDTSKTEIKLKHTIKLPAGFSVESTIPVDMNALNSGDKDPKRFYEGEQFSVFIEITNDMEKYSDTKIRLEYNQNNFEYIYPYYSNGDYLNQLETNVYEFDKDSLPDAIGKLHIIGKTKTIPNHYSYAGMNFRLYYLNDNNEELDNFEHEIKVNKQDFVVKGDIPKKTSIVVI